MSAAERLTALLEREIVLLDGSWGVLIQREVRGEEAYRGERFRDHPRDVAGDPDLLNLTNPQVVRDIHRAYFAAGARIATTNTFTATSIGQADYGLEPWVAEMNVAGARLAREAADEAGGFVAGCVGPLNVTLSLSPKVEDPAFRAVTFDEVCAAYAEQMTALVEGGVDLLMIETVFDTLNAKAAIAAALDVAPADPALDLFHRYRRERAQPVGADGRSVLALRRARRAAARRRQLLARRDGDAPVRRGSGGSGVDVRVVPPERGPSERPRAPRRAARRHEPLSPGVRGGRARQRRRRLLRDDPGPRAGDRRRHRRPRASEDPGADAPCPRSAASSRS